VVGRMESNREREWGWAAIIGPRRVFPTGVGPVFLISVETGSTPAIRSQVTYPE